MLLEYALVVLIERPHENIALADVLAALVLFLGHAKCPANRSVHPLFVVRHSLDINFPGTWARQSGEPYWAALEITEERALQKFGFFYSIHILDCSGIGVVYQWRDWSLWEPRF